MKGTTILLDHINGREAAALMVDGKLHDLLIDPPEDAAPGVGAIAWAVADRPLKGQGGLTLQLGNGLTGYLRRAKDIAPGDAFWVQVSGVAEPGKAIPVTPDLIFKSRYAIITPHKPGLNVSRSIREEGERDRLLAIAHDSRAATEEYGLIIRSSADGADEDDIHRDIFEQCKIATAVLEQRDGPPEWLLGEDSAHVLAWRDWTDPDEIVTEDGSFVAHGVLEAIDAALSPRQPLSGGGHAYIEATRALIAVDVNTGADHSLAAGLKANLALVRDLPRQLRLKGLGGQITLDLAPMPKRDRKQVEDAVKKSFRQDGSDVVVAGWTPLGHLELTRKRDRLPLAQVWPRS
ncbi:ribonuclease E/G [Hasllibacter sp. MH4015]|uniref:ribonuclease E/G n=1 Tax=Hasllibacter sp. MH4015 TaxID=2854029 RepID=UPI001CD7CA21|nr:ribonuclease E/G [Hasllibacter sp. MH4015]